MKFRRTLLAVLATLYAVPATAGGICTAFAGNQLLCTLGPGDSLFLRPIAGVTTGVTIETWISADLNGVCRSPAPRRGMTLLGRNTFPALPGYHQGSLNGHCTDIYIKNCDHGLACGVLLIGTW